VKNLFLSIIFIKSDNPILKELNGEEFIFEYNFY
jgi:hypothetical protein